MKEIKSTGKLEFNFNTQLHQHMDNVGSKLNALVDAIKLARNDGYNLTVDICELENEEQINIRGDYMKNLASKNVDLNTKPLCVNEAINKLAGTFKQIQQTLDSIEIYDAGYSKEFWEEVENALITVAVIKAFGIGKKSEHYLGVVKKVVRELNTAPSKG